ncbi:MAG TPA: glycosyltransferase family 4 protein [bacterium]|nr:glycosyltransferase family 4 protein [bacterium]
MKTRAVHQLLPALEGADAIGGYARALRGVLREAGFASDIFVLDRKPGQSECRSWREHRSAGGPGAVAVFHTAIGSKLAPYFRACPDRKVLVHHNITPARFFADTAPEDAWLALLARRQFQGLAGAVEAAVADSAYNARELSAAGFPAPTVIPLPLPRSLTGGEPDPELLAAVARGGEAILFVGRFAPNKRQDRLIRIFARYRRAYSPGAMLYLVGDRGHDGSYAASLERLARELGVEEAVVMPGKVDDAALRAYYAGADLFLCMSEHEGFGVPLVEALFHRLPVIARAAAAVPDTLGEAGLVVADDDPGRCAALIRRVLTDAGLREKLLRAQDRRLARFRDFPFREAWLEVLAPLLAPA